MANNKQNNVRSDTDDAKLAAKIEAYKEYVKDYRIKDEARPTARPTRKQKLRPSWTANSNRLNS